MAKRSLKRRNARRRFAGLPEFERRKPVTHGFDAEQWVLTTSAHLKANPHLLDKPEARVFDGSKGHWECPGCDRELVEGADYCLPASGERTAADESPPAAVPPVDAGTEAGDDAL